MFASKTSHAFRAIIRNGKLLGNSLRASSVRSTLRFQTSAFQYRTFSNIVDDGTKIAPKKPAPSTLVRTVTGFSIGLFASALGSMCGLGGGFIIIPLLTMIGGMTQHQAASCSLASICVTAITGTGTYISQGLIDLPAAAVITATSMFMARYGTRISHKFDSKTLKKYYGWLCLLVAPLLPLKNYIMQKRKEEEAGKQMQVVDDLAVENEKFGYRDCLSKEAMMNSEAVHHSPLLLTLGIVGGTMSGLFGVGGGIIFSPSLCLFTQMAQKKIMGTSLASMIIPTSISAATNYKMGSLVMSSALPICAGSVIGGYIGSRVAGKMQAKKIQWVLVALLVVSGLKSVL